MGNFVEYDDDGDGEIGNGIPHDYKIAIERFNSGLSVGALSALAIVLLMAFGSGWVSLNPHGNPPIVFHSSNFPASSPAPQASPG